MLPFSIKKDFVSGSDLIFSLDYIYIKETSREPKQNEKTNN